MSDESFILEDWITLDPTIPSGWILVGDRPVKIMEWDTSLAAVSRRLAERQRESQEDTSPPKDSKWSARD